MSYKNDHHRGHSKVSAIKTCDFCKIRHQKCSGERPVCAGCRLNNVDCVYSSLPTHRLSHAPARRSKGSPKVRAASPGVPQAPLNFSTNETLPSKETEVVQALLASDLDELALPESTRKALVRIIVDKIWKQQPTLHLASRTIETTPPCSTLDYLLDRLTQILSQELEVEAYSLNNSLAYDPDDPSVFTPCLSTPAGQLSAWDELAPSFDTSNVWLTTFLNGPNMLMGICSPDESKQLLQMLYSVVDMPPTSRCLILAQLATGCRFTSGTTEDLYGRLYGEASALLEICIEKGGADLLMILQPLLLKILYLLPGKPKNCWVILGTAISVAQSHGIDLGREQCQGLSNTDYTRWREVWGGILFFDAWLSVNLGRRPQVSYQTTHDLFVHDSWTNSSRAGPTISSNIAKLSLLISRLMIDSCDNTIDPEKIQKYLHSLEEWSSSLPSSLRYFPDIDGPRDPSLTLEDEVASLYLEMFYFVTILTLTKPSLFAVVDLLQKDIASIPLHLRFFAQTCLDSASQIGQTATTIMRRAFLCKRSWLVTTLNYHASLVILLSLSVKRSKVRYSMGSRHVLEVPSLASLKCVLKESASVDHYATSYLEILERFEGIMLNRGRPGGHDLPQTATVTPNAPASSGGGYWSSSPNTSVSSSLLPTGPVRTGLIPSNSSFSSDSFLGVGGTMSSPPYQFDPSMVTGEATSFAWPSHGQGQGQVELLAQDMSLDQFVSNDGGDSDMLSGADVPTTMHQHYPSFLHNFYGVTGGQVGNF